MKRYDWSEEEKEALRNLSEAGYTLSEVATSGIFKDRSRDGIANACRRFNIKLHGPDPTIDMARLKELLDGTIRDKGSKIRKA